MLLIDPNYIKSKSYSNNCDNNHTDNRIGSEDQKLDNLKNPKQFCNINYKQKIFDHSGILQDSYISLSWIIIYTESKSHDNNYSKNIHNDNIVGDEKQTLDNLKGLKHLCNINYMQKAFNHSEVL